MKCEICGKEIEKSVYHGNVICSDKCFGKLFWQKIIAEKDKHIIIDGKCYCDEGMVKNPSPYAFLGHSGRCFWIKFKNGKTLTTNNLWYQGEIPDEFRKELPDTAEFFSPAIHSPNILF